MFADYRLRTTDVFNHPSDQTMTHPQAETFPTLQNSGKRKIISREPGR